MTGFRFRLLDQSETELGVVTYAVPNIAARRREAAFAPRAGEVWRRCRY